MVLTYFEDLIRKLSVFNELCWDSPSTICMYISQLPNLSLYIRREPVWSPKGLIAMYPVSIYYLLSIQGNSCEHNQWGRGRHVSPAHVILIRNQQLTIYTVSLSSKCYYHIDMPSSYNWPLIKTALFCKLFRNSVSFCHSFCPGDANSGYVAENVRSSTHRTRDIATMSTLQPSTSSQYQ